MIAMKSVLICTNLPFKLLTVYGVMHTICFLLPLLQNMQATFTTNDIVIQKLTQILSYLRTGRANKKQKKKDKGKNESVSYSVFSISEHVKDYL